MLPIIISIVVPVKNGGLTLKQCLDSIFNQTIIGQTEVIIVDSGSTDDSLEIIGKYNVSLYQISPEAFNHGATRNYGVSLAKGELVYLTVQDAIAADNTLLERMAAHFSDPTVMAVAGRQIVPHDLDKNPHQWFRPVNQPKVERFLFGNANEFDNLPGNKKRWVCGLDDVNAMYRRTALINLPFRDLQFAEDMVWAVDAYRRGYTIILDQAARVNHYHHQNFNFAYKVSLLCAFAEWKYLEIEPESRLPVYDLLLVPYRNIKYKAHPKWIGIQSQFILGQYKAKFDLKKEIQRGSKNLENIIQFKIKTIPQGSTK